MGNECFSKKFIEEDYLYEIRKEKFFSEKETKDEDSYLQTKISYKSSNENVAVVDGNHGKPCCIPP